MCGWKYNMSVVENLLVSQTVTKFKKSSTFVKLMNEYQVTRFLWLTVYICCV